MNDLIEFRWRQERDRYSEETIGRPVLQWRSRFRADGDGVFVESVSWTNWITVPLVDEYVG